LAVIGMEMVGNAVSDVAVENVGVAANSIAWRIAGGA
jgi:hypothetical protein